MSFDVDHRSTMNSMISVAVTGPSGDVGHGVVLALRESIMPLLIVGLDFRNHYAGQRYCDSTEQMPPVASDEYFPSLITVLQRKRVDFLLCGIDSEVRILAANASEIFESTGCRVLVPNLEFVETCADKCMTSEWLSSLGIRVPGTCSGDRFRLLSQSGGLNTFPLILKPRRGHSSIGVLKIADQSDLDQNWGSIDQHICVQEYLPGPEYTCGLLYDREGQLRDWIVTRRELSGGRTVVAEVCQDSVLDEFIADFGRTVRATGSINLQLRLDTDGHPAIFEINPRFSGSTIMRLAAGYNDAARLIENVCLGHPIHRQVVRPVRILREWKCQTSIISDSRSIKPGTIKSLVLDCGGTLLRQSPSSEAICQRVLKDLGIFVPFNTVEDAYRLADTGLKRKSSQEDSPQDRIAFFSRFNLRLAELLGIESIGADFHHRLYESCSMTERHWEPMPGVAEALQALSGSFELFVLANWDRDLARVLARAQLDHYFKEIVDSATVGVEKPDPRIFDFFIQKSGVDPARTAYIGNEYEADVVGSRQAGFIPILFDSSHRYSPGVDCHYVNSWKELRACVAKKFPESNEI